MTNATRITIHPDAVFTRLSDSSASVLHLVTKRYYTLNDTGVRIWELLESRGEVDQVATALTEEYDIELEAAMSRVRHFVDDLASEGLLQPASA